jgi:hypothetical protein
VTARVRGHSEGPDGDRKCWYDEAMVLRRWCCSMVADGLERQQTSLWSPLRNKKRPMPHWSCLECLVVACLAVRAGYRGQPLTVDAAMFVG